jgi:RNA polymerase sigma-70 factor (ECF subfamily)
LPFAFPSCDESQYRHATMPPGGRDIELVARANRGDTAAFEQIYHCYRDFVFRAALHRLGNTDDALDVVQDTFMKLFARFPGFELTSAMSRFLYSMVDRLCRDRHARRRPMIDIEEVDSGTESLIAPREDSSDTTNLLSRLRPEQRELLTLRFVDDLSLPQLAATLGAPVGTIKSRLHRAIAALRRTVDAPGRKP